MFIAGLLAGEAAAPPPGAFSAGATRGLRRGAFPAESIIAFAYLVVFGSLLAFTAYAWLLANAPISQVATYAYVNPVVAIALGAPVAGEDITPAAAAGAAVILSSVAVTVRQEAERPVPQRSTG